MLRTDGASRRTLRTVLVLGLTYCLVWGGIPAPALAEMMAGDDGNATVEAVVSEDFAALEEEDSYDGESAKSANGTALEEGSNALEDLAANNATIGETAVAVQADGDNIAEGTWGTCPWEIDSAGTLTVHAGVGEDLENYGSVPWYANRTDIKAAIFKEGVKLPKSCNTMFFGCSELSSLDLSGWDTSAVTSMKGMFYGCSELSSLDLTGWDTSAVTSMGSMFFGCSELSSLDLSGWDTSAVTDVTLMFDSCSSLASVGDLSGWDTSAIADMWSMFAGCSELSSLDLSGWDTSAVTDMQSMFYGCSSLSSLDLSGWDTSAVTGMDSMFEGCSKLGRVVVGKSFTLHAAFPTHDWYSHQLNECISKNALTARVGIADTYTSCKPSGELPIDTATITVAGSFEYTGKQVRPEPIVSLNGASLSPAEDYWVSYENNIDVGVATIIVHGWGNYKGVCSASFLIEGTDLSNAEIGPIDPHMYDGSEARPRPTVTLGGETLEEGTDYELSYRDNVGAGTATVVVTGCGGYQGEVTSEFTIAPKPATVTAVDASKALGKADPELTATVEGLLGDDALEYSLSREPGETCGIYNIYVTGDELQGNYRVDYIAGTLTITAGDIEDAEITGVTDQVYKGLAIEQVPLVSIGGKTLKAGADYDVSYKNNINVGTASVVLSGRGEYVGEKIVTFEIMPKQVVVTANNATKFSDDADPVFTTQVDGTLGDDDVVYSIKREPGNYAGTYVITPYGESFQGNYKVKYVCGTLTVVGVKKSGTFGKGFTYKLTADELYVIGSGVCGQIPSGITRYNNSVRLIIGEGITSVEKEGGYYNSFIADNNISEIVFPNSLTSIGANAFLNNEYLKKVDIPKNVQSIGSNAFSNCPNLTTLTFETNSCLSTIDSYAFSACSALTSVQFPLGVSSLGSHSFSRCSSLRNIKLPTQVKTIGDAAFNKCDEAFGKTLVIPSTVQSIGSEAFYSSTSSVSTIEFEGNAPAIGSGAFVGIKDAKAIYPAGNRTWSEDKRGDYGGKLTWYSRRADGSLTQDPYRPTIPKVIIKQPAPGGYENKLAWMVPLGGKKYSTEYEMCSFEITVPKRQKLGIDLRWSGPSACTHGSICFFVKDNYGKSIYGPIISGTDVTHDYHFEIDANPGTVHIETSYVNTHYKTSLCSVIVGYRVIGSKAPNAMTAQGRTIKAKAKSLKKKTQYFKANKAVRVKSASGKLTYKLVGVSKKKYKKYFKVASDGRVTVKKGLRKGTYSLKVNVTAAGDANHTAVTKTVTVKVKVK